MFKYIETAISVDLLAETEIFDQLCQPASQPASQPAIQLRISKNASDTSRLKNIIKQVDAFFALEGFQPTGSILDTDRAVLAGVGTYAESTKELVEYVKTSQDGERIFIQQYPMVAIGNGSKWLCCRSRSQSRQAAP